MTSPRLRDIQAVLFDLDGTLFDRETAVREVVAGQHAAFSGELDGVTRERFVGRMLELDAHGYGDKSEIYPRLVRELGLPEPLAARLHAHFWDAYAQVAPAMPGARATLAALRARGRRLGVVTNGRVRVQEGKLRALDLLGALDVVLISEREQLRKPDPAIFRRALERLGVRAEQACYVGDHPMKDAQGARDAGLHAVWLRTPHFPPPEAAHTAIDDLGELLALV
ncbi:HAD family hydrolase [Sorangium sp. So ce1335]|uniref:HAD family hydrolase n=1 Tax=Sorangium sp. So ce1335 TaxID=3133335 RepID=UPI003F60A837